MGRKSAAILDFQKKYKIADDELWEVHGSAWVVKHKALERVAAEQGITFGPPTVTEARTESGIVSLWVPGALGDRKEWATGEASPKNNKNAYPWAMAEKRAKDRVILKLLNGHGDLYSSADDFETDETHNPTPRREPETLTISGENERRNPNSWQDVFARMDTTDIQINPTVRRITVVEAKEHYKVLRDEYKRIADIGELVDWASSIEVGTQISRFPDKMRDYFRAEYASYKDGLAPPPKANGKSTPNLIMAG